MARKITTEIFIKEMKEKFPKKHYDYSKVNYINASTKIEIICPKHGSFFILPNNFRHGQGCVKCTRSVPRKPVIKGIKRKQMREYRIWKAIKTRTTNPNTDDADRYINRGITCCKEWLDSFEQFYKDMGPCPDGYSIDRIDNDKGYSPDNCRWTTSQIQSINRGDFNIVITYNNESHVLKEWARIFNIPYSCLYGRIRKGMNFENAIKKDPYNRLYEFNGEKKTLIEWCKIYNIKYQTVITRINKHKWTLKEALLTPYNHRKIKDKDIV